MRVRDVRRVAGAHREDVAAARGRRVAGGSGGVVPAGGDDVDLVSGLRKEQLDAAARRAMIDQKMMRQRGDAGLAKGEVRLFLFSTRAIILTSCAIYG